MAFGEQKKMIRPGTARLLAVLFLACGILLAVFDAPRILERVGLGGVAGFIERTVLDVPFRFGLDIQGGTHLVYRADLAATPSGERADSMEALRDVIERRVNLFGVAEPVVQVERAADDWRLIVELAGIRDINAAIRLIGETPFLEFREEREEKEREAILEAQKTGERMDEDPYFIPTKLNGKYLKRAEVSFNQTTFEPEVILQFTDEGAEIFADITRQNVGKLVAIYLDGAPISAPVVQEEITGGTAQITGRFSPEEAKELVGRMNAGALPVPIALIAQQSVGASLGEASLAKSLYAGLIGLLAVALFMILWYRLPGLLAVIALLFYVVIILAIFKLIPVTLTLAGVAGIILSIGMAVDANILIFERMKEELRTGKALEEALRDGFGRAWTSIRDSNVSSLITAAILYWFGSSLIKGFALTLSIGILISMFSAISVTRTLLIAVMTRRVESIRALFLSGFAK